MPTAHFGTAITCIDGRVYEQAVDIVGKWRFPVAVVGLYVNERWEVEMVG